ncbi:hypothetical protein [Halomonas elongata]|uniref:hypothetical protein n=1 Tax=Halomonas elongata TaxID=2746 RepID=UPI00186B751E|nr:hypothetical protein [Halomonas elongata]MBW5801165.1 hypothetical protein [Halomonas elongata]
MSIIQRIHDRLTGVLGRDCEGRPLRVGDLVEPSPFAGPVKSWAHGTLVITGKEPDQTEYPGEVEVRTASGRFGCAPPSWLRKIEGDNDDANWANVTEATGWTPRTVEKPSEVVT